MKLTNELDKLKIENSKLSSSDSVKKQEGKEN